MPLSYSFQNGNGVTTNFVIPFSFLDKSHVHVAIGGVENNTFTWVNSSTVQITPAPPNGTGNVKLYRVTPRNQQIVTFTNGNVLEDTDLNASALQGLYVLQEYFEAPPQALPSGHSIYSHTDADPAGTYTKGTLLVVGNGASFVSLGPGTDGQTLEADSTDNKGVAWKQGLRKLLTTVGDLLYCASAGVAGRLGVGTDGQILVARPNATPPMAWETSPVFSTGDVKPTFKNVADSSWVMMNDGTIGDAISGATTRANADTAALFTLLWNNIPNTWCAVSSGRGVSAAADFAAHKTIALPKALGRLFGVAGVGVGLTSRALAEVLGSENSIVVLHNHGITDPGHLHGAGGGGSSGPFAIPSDGGGTAGASSNTTTNTTGITINNSGSSGTGMNMPPTVFANWMIKL
ncbi:MAG: hypothetical protein A4E20_01470 [Nitrospira sp. SG-bin2]|uniref:phage tail fiber domain-containing protein n=1 Tax=Nitrospira cf. moscoviensis SBR1015 TaxID=96242 RepID=UPI000A0DED4B|nr:phage tail fiber protein [Nitrospira cf. moscoviensis SBR1015]OQW34874.1 MAG: hypothetical protein A4E20_01470 [Nitrospira sp. SG-bin2]